jgi:synaptojanin
MSMELYINDATRTLAICSNEYVLILMDSSSSREYISSNYSSHHSHSHSSHSIGSETSSPKCLIEFVPRHTVPLNTFRRVQKEVYGFLGLISLKGNIYAGFITGKSRIATTVPEVNIYQLINTMFINFNGEIHTLSNQVVSESVVQQMQYLEESYEGQEVSSQTSRITSIMKLLETGTFYYSADTDLAVKTQEWDIGNRNDYAYTPVGNLQDDYSGRFVWNSNLISELSVFRCRLSNEERTIFDKGRFYITLIRGYVQSETFGTGGSGRITLISRQDSRKIGHMFGPACMDDEGNVANYVETEVVIYTGDHLVAFSIVKGNVPLFWKLDNHLLTTKIEFPRSEDASRHAFVRFFETMCTEYNMVYVIDALSSKGSQPELSQRYAHSIHALQKEYPELSVGYRKLSNGGTFGHRFKGKTDYISILLQDDLIHTALENYSLYQFDFKEWSQSGRQLGTFLVNTLDSNDRANLIECKISEMVLEKIFGPAFNTQIWDRHNTLWVSNGTALGKLSESYNASIKTKNKTGGLVGKVAEQGKKYAEQSKKYVSNSSTHISSSSTGRQTQFDKLLGRRNKEVQVELIDPIHDYVLSAMNKRRDEFTSQKELTIYTVTFNVNAILYDGDLTEMIFPEKETFCKYDLIAIALEEVIELTPSKTLSIDLRTRTFWETRFKDTINRKNEKRVYQLLRGEQLGGVLLLIYASVDIIDSIKDVETCVKKTGFKGISANKGGVAVTFTFSTHSRLCFVASHLAAGQSNSEERHQNYKTIANGLSFKKCKNIKDSDVLIWMGDLNYRISLPTETVRKLLGMKSTLGHTNHITNNQSMDSVVSDQSYSSDVDGSSIMENYEDPSLSAAELHQHKSQKLEMEFELENQNEQDLKEKLLKRHNIRLVVESDVNDGKHEKPEARSNSEETHADDTISRSLGEKTLRDLSRDEETSSQVISVRDGNNDHKATQKLDISSTTKLDSTSRLSNHTTDRESSGESDKGVSFRDNSSRASSFYNTSQEKLIKSATELTETEEQKVLSQLYEYDQLNHQMANGQTFPFFDEMEIHFKPTYKFDKGTDVYDTSEKQRVPSWTDRILTHTKNKRVTSLEQLRYDSIPIFKFSDHKPVYGIFVAKLELVNDSVRANIEKEIYDTTKQKFYSNNGSGGAIAPGVLNSLMAESRKSKTLKHGLPAPSSKDSRWWISKEKDREKNEEKIGKVKIQFLELESGEYMINPEFPLNPFVKTNEPRFVPKDGL